MNAEKFLWHLPVDRYTIKVIEKGSRTYIDCKIERIFDFTEETVDIRLLCKGWSDIKTFNKTTSTYKGNTFSGWDICGELYIILTCLDMPDAQDFEILTELQTVHKKLDQLIESLNNGKIAR